MAKEELNITEEELRKLTEDYLVNQKTLSDLKGITKEELEATYAAAYNFYNYGKFDQAESLFTVLCQLDQYEHKFWMGLGASRQMQKKFEEATLAYGMAAVMDENNPNPAMHAADCFIAMKNFSQAEKALVAVLTLCEGKNEHKKLLDKANEKMETIKKKLGESTKKGE